MRTVITFTAGTGRAAEPKLAGSCGLHGLALAEGLEEKNQGVRVQFFDVFVMLDVFAPLVVEDRRVLRKRKVNIRTVAQAATGRSLVRVAKLAGEKPVKPAFSAESNFPIALAASLRPFRLC